MVLEDLVFGIEPTMMRYQPANRSESPLDIFYPDHAPVLPVIEKHGLPLGAPLELDDKMSIWQTSRKDRLRLVKPTSGGPKG